MNPGDRILVTDTTTMYGFLLYESNINDDAVVRFDGNDFNSVVDGTRLIVLPSEPFRPYSAPPVVTVDYHVAQWPYNHGAAPRRTELHRVPASWVATDGAIVDRITVE